MNSRSLLNSITWDLSALFEKREWMLYLLRFRSEAPILLFMGANILLVKIKLAILTKKGKIETHNLSGISILRSFYGGSDGKIH